jgi:ATP-dependent DNA helicase RecQ
VRRVEDEHRDRHLLEQLLVGDGLAPDGAFGDRLRAAARGPGIVYVATTKSADETAGWLREWGIEADSYHGRRRAADRTRVQDAFRDGALRVVVATNAFGLGVDKPDVRFVVHRDVPASVEAYYQEAGRAGRDGEFARCLLLFRPGDLGRAAFLAGGGGVRREDVAAVRMALHAARGGLTQKQLADAAQVSAAEVALLVPMLEREGLVRQARRRVSLAVDDFDPDAVSLEAEERRRAYERSRIDMMRGYADTPDCRRRYVLNYLGEEYDAEACRMCDHSVEPPAEGGEPSTAPPEDELPDDAPFALGQQVRHAEWGDGAVQRVTADAVTVLFESAGYRTLDVGLVLDGGLLEPVEPAA